jgi:hypothetical protein
MNLYKKIDGYLMRNYPAVWETKVHFFLPLIWAILLLLFGFGFVMPADMESNNSFFEFTPMLMVPSVVLLVFWIISAVKYNVFKSGGKSGLGHDYSQLLIYFLIVFSTMQIPMAPVFGVHQKMKMSFNMDEIQAEKEILNKGNTILTWNRYDVDEESPGYYSLRKRELIHEDYGIFEMPKFYTANNDNYVMNRNEMIAAIHDFKVSVYKITQIKLDVDPTTYVDENLANNFSNQLRYTEDFRSVNNYFRNAQNYGAHAFPKPFNELFPWLIMAGLALLASTIFWIFKRNRPKNFFLGLIAVVASPAIFGIITLFLGITEVLGHGDEDIILFGIVWVVLIAYGIIALIQALGSQSKHWIGIMTAMAFQFYFPIILFATSAYAISENFHGDEEGGLILTVFFLTVALALVMIIPMKMVYKKHWFLPNAK